MVATALDAQTRAGGLTARASEVLPHLEPRQPSAVRRWLIVVAAVAMLLSYAPLAVAWCCGPPQMAGLGTFWFINDFAQYESAMHQAATTDSWAINNRFTPEAHEPAFMFGLYVVVGKLAATTGATIELVYRLLELGARAALLFSLAAFVVWALGWTRAAVLAFAFALFGMGLGLPVAVAGALLGIPDVYTGNGSYEVNTFGLLFSAPHAALAMAVTLAIPIGIHLLLSPVTRATDNPPAAHRSPVGTVLALALGGLTLALLHPFHLPVLLLAGGTLAWLLFRSGALKWRAIAAALAPAAFAAPPALYAAATFNRDAFWGAVYGAQNLLPSPTPWQLPIDYGVALALALPGAAVLWRRGGLAGRWLLLWAAAIVVAMYLPVPYQRRFSFALQPLLAVFAAVGLFYARSWLRSVGREGLARVAQPLALALALMTTATAWVGITASALSNAPMEPYRAHASEVEAAGWLAGAMEAEEVVLAAWDTSNFIAGRIPGRVVGGHPVATLNPSERRAAIIAFFARDDDRERQLAARRYGVTYVFYGPREQALGPLNPDGWLRPVYHNRDVIIFSVHQRP